MTLRSEVKPCLALIAFLNTYCCLQGGILFTAYLHVVFSVTTFMIFICLYVPFVVISCIIMGVSRARSEFNPTALLWRFLMEYVVEYDREEPIHNEYKI